MLMGCEFLVEAATVRANVGWRRAAKARAFAPIVRPLNALHGEMRKPIRHRTRDLRRAGAAQLAALGLSFECVLQHRH